MSTEVSTLVAQLAYRLGGTAEQARLAGLPTLADAVGGLQQVLADEQHKLRPSDGRALLHALAGFDAIFIDLQIEDDVEELRGAMAAAQMGARELAEALERPR